MFSKTVSDPEFGNIVIHKNRRSRRITLRVRAKAGKDGAMIYVTVPWSVPYQAGIDFIERKRGWIRQTMSEISGRNKEKAEKSAFRDGSTVNTLLTSATIHIRPFGDRPAIGILQEAFPKDTLERAWYSLDTPLRLMDIYVNTDAYGQARQAGHGQTSQADAENAIQDDIRNAIVEQCLRRESKLFLRFKLEHFAAKYGFKFGRLAIKHNSSNWGSCSRRGNINLNLNLMRLPEPLCDYVILHELCHLREPNHGPKFHTLLNQLCLDNIRALIAAGSPDAQKYGQWINYKVASGKDPDPEANPQHIPSTQDGARNTGSTLKAGLPPLDRVLSREIKKYGLM